MAEKQDDSSVPTAKSLRYDWYQTTAKVIITIFERNVNKDDFTIKYEPDRLSVDIKLPSSDNYDLQLLLANEIVVEQCSFKIYSTKIEIQLQKKDATHWTALEKPMVEKIQASQATTASGIAYPSSYKKPVDWNNLESEIKKEESSESSQGLDSLNKLFQDIYSRGGDEVKKAMNKSFFESGGTVLSTNWNEIGNKTVDVVPPDGVEYKKWES